MKYLARLIEYRNNSVTFDMSKSYNENRRLTENISKLNYSHDAQPIEPVESDWQEINHKTGVYLAKTYNFKNVKHIKYFLSECIDKSELLAYYPEIFIKQHDVKIYLKNQFTNQVSDEDIKFSKFLNEVYEDIFYLNS
jgi:pterin-4a-carbinolamine dehydratase